MRAEKGMGRGRQGGWELEQRTGQQPARNPSALCLEIREGGSLRLGPPRGLDWQHRCYPVAVAGL